MTTETLNILRKSFSERFFIFSCVGGANIFDETFMLEMHISTTLKSYSNWRIKTFISRDDHDDAKQKRQ